MAITRAFLVLTLLLPWCGEINAKPLPTTDSGPVAVERPEAVLLALRYQAEIRSVLAALPTPSSVCAGTPATAPITPAFPNEPCSTDLSGARALSMLMSFQT